MNLQIVRSGKSNHDLTLYKNGVGTLASEFVKKFALENKNVLIALDQDDKEHKFIYFTVDLMGKDTNGFIVKKSAGGSFQFSSARLANLFEQKKIKYVFHNQVTHNAKGFLQLIRLEDNHTEEQVSMPKRKKLRNARSDA